MASACQLTVTDLTGLGGMQGIKGVQYNRNRKYGLHTAVQTN